MLETPENIFSVDRSRSNFLHYKIDFFKIKEQKCFFISQSSPQEGVEACNK